MSTPPYRTTSSRRYATVSLALVFILPSSSPSFPPPSSIPAPAFLPQYLHSVTAPHPRSPPSPQSFPIPLFATPPCPRLIPRCVPTPLPPPPCRPPRLRPCWTCKILTSRSSCLQAP